MSGTSIVVEEGVIQCEHGAPVILKSTVPNHVIGGKKPLFTTDLLEAKIDGCGYNSSNGGQCKMVASITSAITETNNSNAGKNYLLRVDGCKTDNGSSLVLVNSGQTNTVIPVKAGGSTGSITANTLETPKVTTREEIKKENYRLYPLRKSGVHYRALRGTRKFDLRKDFHCPPGTSYEHDKVVTKTASYLYATHKGITQEYKIVNTGDTFNPRVQDVCFENKKGTRTRYLPIHADSGNVELVYSNIELNNTARSEFTAKIVTLGKAENDHVQHHKVYSKHKTISEKSLDKKFISQKEAKESKANYLNLVIKLEDPVGEIEDLYNDYEWSYHFHYGQNKATIEEVRVKNQYPYAVADMLEYMHVEKDEQTNLNTHVTELAKQYKVMQEIVVSQKFTDALDKTKKEAMLSNLKNIIDFEVAKDFLDEVQFVSKSFFEDTPYFNMQINNTKYPYFGWKPSLSMPAPKKGNWLKLYGKEYSKIRYKNKDVQALLVFSFCYSKKHETELNKFPKLVEAREKFYYTLKTAEPLPQINKKAMLEIQTELSRQNELQDIFKAEKPESKLFEEFESLDVLHKELSFDPSLAKERNGKKELGFKSLLVANTSAQFFLKPTVLQPKVVAKTIASKIKLLADTLELHHKLAEKIDPDTKLDYYHYGLNLAYVLSAPRAFTDSESDLLSPFNSGFEHVNLFLNRLTKGMNAIKDEKEALELHEYGIKEHYLNGLYSLIGHALIGKDAGRKNAAKNLLSGMPVRTQEQEAKFNEINDYNYDKNLKIKSEIDERYEQLKNINGISSKFSDFDTKIKDGAYGAHKTSSGLGDNRSNTSHKGIGTSWLENQQNLKSYKNILSTTKGLAFLMTVGSIAEYLQKGHTEKIKAHNIIAAVSDLISISTAMAEKGVKLSEGSVKSVSTFVDKLANVDKSSLKLVAKLGAVGIIVTTMNTYSELDENDTDGRIAVLTKNAMVLALLFTPGWAAVATIIVVELAWIFLKDHFVDSAMEIYLRKNLMFDSVKPTGSLGNSLSIFMQLSSGESVGKRFISPIMLDTLKTTSTQYTYNGSLEKANKIEGFSTIKEMRVFIAENYKLNPLAFETAMSNELNTIKQVLYGLKIEADTEAEPTLKYKAYKANVFYATSIKISDDLMKNNEHIVIHTPTGYTPLDKEKELTSNTGYSSYDLLSHVRSNNRQALLDMKDTDKRSVIIVNSDIILKYNVIYEEAVSFADYSKLWAQNGRVISIKKLKQVALTTQDYEYIKSLIDGEEKSA